MLLSLFNTNMDFLGKLVLLLGYAVLILVMLPVHEFAHAWAADRLGDPTARWQGRLSLNPFRHLDLFGTVMLVVCGFGYAKPVPVDPSRFRMRNRKAGMALTALAGPVSNLLMAFLSLLIFRSVCLMTGEEVYMDNGYVYASSDGIFYLWIGLVMVFAGINLSLAVFNLLPIPPLDGSRIFALVLPNRWLYYTEVYGQYIRMAMFVLLFTGALSGPLDFLSGLVGWLLCVPLGLPNYFI